jgi:hypothetical protein
MLVIVYQLLAELSEGKQLPEHVVLEEDYSVLLDICKVFDLPMLRIGLLRKLLQPNPSAFHSDESGLIRSFYTFSKAYCISSC